MTGPDQVEVEINPSDELAAKVAELARMSPLEYDQQRDQLAKELNVRVKTLDAEVGKLRSSETEENAEQVVEEISPWSESVKGADLLNQIQTLYRRHCVMQAPDYPVMSVLALATYVFDAFPVFPKVLIRSPEKRCGKTVLLEVSEAIVYRGLMASSITASSLFRIIDAHHPTLIIDEADTFMIGNEEMRGVINSSHRRRNAFVIRTEKVADQFVPKRFTTWSPMFIAGIGSQADTIEDRSIIIELRRKLPAEKVTKCPVDFFEKNLTLRRKCLRWAEDNINRLKLADFELPDCGNDRAADNWFPLFAIGRLIGKPWQDQIERAYIGKNSGAEDEAIGVMVLRDIRTAFACKNWLKMHSETLVNYLIDMEDRPWPEWKHGKPMTKTSLARLLKPYKIRSRQMKILEINRYGYERKQFEDAWKRYANEDLSMPSKDSHVQTATTLQPLRHKALPDFVDATGLPCVVFLKSLKPLQDRPCSEVAFSHGVTEDQATLVDW